MNDAFENPIPPAIESLIALFHSDLQAVRFPDVDAEALELVADEVRAASSEVQRAEEALAAAMRELAQRQESLLQKSQRALAYARIFAEENPDLLTRLDAVQLPRAARKPTRTDASLNATSESAEPAAGRRRGRPRKSSESGTERLFGQDAPAEMSAASSALS